MNILKENPQGRIEPPGGKKSRNGPVYALVNIAWKFLLSNRLVN